MQIGKVQNNIHKLNKTQNCVAFGKKKEQVQSTLMRNEIYKTRLSLEKSFAETEKLRASLHSMMFAVKEKKINVEELRKMLNDPKIPDKKTAKIIAEIRKKGSKKLKEQVLIEPVKNKNNLFILALDNGKSQSAKIILEIAEDSDKELQNRFVRNKGENGLIPLVSTFKAGDWALYQKINNMISQ